MRISCWSSYVCSSYLPACESREVVIPAKAGIQCPWLLCTLTAEPTAPDDIRLRFRHRAGNDDPKRRSARHQRGTIDLPPIPEAAVSNPPANLQRLLDIMARLRDRENGCPWDIEIGRAHVCTPVTNAHLVCRLLLDKQKQKVPTPHNQP